MKIKNYKITGVIPTVQYGNIQPSIEMEGDDLDEMKELGLNHIKELHSRFSDTELKETTNSIDEWILKPSFNESVNIEFNPTTHEYKDDDGKSFLSGSVFASSFYPKFDSEGVAKNCEKSWGVPAKDIVDMWNSNGSLSSDFGNVIHKALEHYLNNFVISMSIAYIKGDKEDRAMPKHPILKSIIEGFLKIDESKGEFKNEVLVTDVKNLRCGIIDRLLILDGDKKICRVQDYKVNVGAEDESSNLKAKAPYDKLPKNKLTKYQLQLSFYADILKQSGWTIDGLDIFILNDGWKHYPLELLDINKSN